MAKVNLSKHKEGFATDQKDMTKGPDIRAGKYHVVNIELGRATFGTGSKKVRPLCYVLAALDEENKDLVGIKFGFDLWCDLSKGQSAKKWTYLLMAHGNDEMLDGFDPDDDEMIVKGITGRPYLIEVTTDQRSYKDKDGNEKSTLDVEPTNFGMLSKEQRAPYNTEKWGKEILTLAPADRVKVFEKKEKTDGGKSSGGSKASAPETHADPFADPQG